MPIAFTLVTDRKTPDVLIYNTYISTPNKRTLRFVANRPEEGALNTTEEDPEVGGTPVL